MKRARRLGLWEMRWSTCEAISNHFRHSTDF
jgi:hypothetical protein